MQNFYWWQLHSGITCERLRFKELVFSIIPLYFTLLCLCLKYCPWTAQGPPKIHVSVSRSLTFSLVSTLSPVPWGPVSAKIMLGVTGRCFSVESTDDSRVIRLLLPSGICQAWEFWDSPGAVAGAKERGPPLPCGEWPSVCLPTAGKWNLVGPGAERWPWNAFSSLILLKAVSQLA